MKALKSSITQCSGGLIDQLISSDFEDRPLAAGQQVVSWLCEESLSIVQSEGNVNFYKAKPIFRAAIYLIKIKIKRYNEQIAEIDDVDTILEIKSVIKKYKEVEKLLLALTEVEEGKYA